MEFLRQWWSQRKRRQPASKWTTVEVAGGPRIMLDRDTVQYLASKAPQPTQQSLDAVLGRAKSFRLIEGGVRDGQPLGNELLLEGNDQVMLSGLRQVLRIVDGPAGHCMCYGDPTIEFLDAVGDQLAVIGVQHGKAIRWREWHDDAALIDGLALMKWLAAQGVQYPLEQYETELRMSSAALAAWERWVAAMPSCLQPLEADREQSIGMLTFLPSPSVAANYQVSPVANERRAGVKQALEKAYPDVVERARALFVWYGHGVGVWSGFPAYETVAEDALMDTQIDGVLRALQGPSVSQPLLEGAARLLAGRNFSTKYGPELRRLPAELRQQLLEVGMQTTNTDRIERAKAAFGS